MNIEEIKRPHELIISLYESKIQRIKNIAYSPFMRKKHKLEVIKNILEE